MSIVSEVAPEVNRSLRIFPSPADLEWYAANAPAWEREARESQIREQYPVCRQDNPELYDALMDRYPVCQDDEEAIRIEQERLTRNLELSQRFRCVSDLMREMAGFLATLGLEPDMHHGTIEVLYLGRTIQLQATDLDAEFEQIEQDHRGVTGDEVDRMASGLAVG